MFCLLKKYVLKPFPFGIDVGPDAYLFEYVEICWSIYTLDIQIRKCVLIQIGITLSLGKLTIF